MTATALAITTDAAQAVQIEYGIDSGPFADEYAEAMLAALGIEPDAVPAWHIANIQIVDRDDAPPFPTFENVQAYRITRTGQ